MNVSLSQHIKQYKSWNNILKIYLHIINTKTYL